MQRVAYESTLQALSGAGYPGVPSLDIIGNVVPYIGGEEDKVETESTKLLGRIKDNAIEFSPMDIQATAVRVPTIEGHLLSVSVSLKEKPTGLEQVKRAVTEWKNPIADLDLPSSPEKAIRLYEENRFPQPRLHSYRDGGMQTAIGRLREGSVHDIGYVTLAHNTIRGAAGGAILNAELIATKGFFG